MFSFLKTVVKFFPCPSGLYGFEMGKVKIIHNPLIWGTYMETILWDCQTTLEHDVVKTGVLK